jgi:hypothetical protein
MGAAHPRFALGVEVPVRLGFSGGMNLQTVRERFRFAVDTAPMGVSEESRSAGGVSFGSWINPSFRPNAGLGLERWSGGRKYLDVTAGAEFRAAGDRLVIATTGQYAHALANHRSWTRGDMRAQWASAVGLSRRSWSARLGVDLTSHNAPLGVRPVASGDDPWVIPLRAHPRTLNGLLPGATTGQGMIHGGLSGDQPVYRAGLVTLAVGVFLDGAQPRIPPTVQGGIDSTSMRRRHPDWHPGRTARHRARRSATGLTTHRSAITVDCTRAGHRSGATAVTDDRSSPIFGA